MRSWAQEGIYVLSYINPHLADWGELFKVAKTMGCLVKNRDGTELVQASATPDFTFGTVDLTNPKCQDWYVQVMRRNMLNVTSVEEQDAAGDLPSGAMGWMADFAEMLPFDVELHGGSGATIHNAFPTIWAETCAKAIGVTPELARDAVFWTRSGGTQSPKYTTLQWMGDQLATFDTADGLMSALTGVLTGGISGFSLSHSDVGGYTMVNKAGGLIKYVRGKEVLTRWMELSAFSDAVFRSHEGELVSLQFV
jgi:alpha-glucosidase